MWGRRVNCSVCCVSEVPYICKRQLHLTHRGVDQTYWHQPYRYLVKVYVGPKVKNVVFRLIKLKKEILVTDHK